MTCSLNASTCLIRIWLALLSGIAIHDFERKVVGEDQRPYMISARNVRGLPNGQPGLRNDGSEFWKADVEETQWEYIIFHHSATTAGSVESIHRDHSKRKDQEGNQWLGIGYHFVIGNGREMSDGAIQSTFRWQQQIHGAHSGNAVLNSRGIGICLIGNLDESPPTMAQLQSLKRLVKALTIRHRITPENLMGHNAFKTTACPGKHFPLNELRQVVSETVH